ncbi:tRNA (guanine(37)-N1)-methyltransferase [Fasciolopsis buskii]|uniref:tRNA (guanine(37)-N1)-methyltransferase n=1 Tax=Fasciolopsis buskii TaxID=27845 RepID=A0A8E0RRR6_9TREM|nr:tRNA (guanine(37)-N1)-methyltransferase [Fasciolopsis buski]
MDKGPSGSCETDDEPQSQAPEGLPPIDKSFTLNRDSFKRTVPMLAVGLVCNNQTKQTCAKLHPYFPSYIRIPKLTYTYHDAEQRMRKLMLIEQGMTETDNAKLVEKLESLEVDVRLSPCTLLSAANEGIPPDGHASSTGNACVMEGSATTDKMDKPSVVQGPPILTPDQLKDVQSPGALLLQVTYDNFNFEQVLKEILPGHVVPVTGFTTMGHIAHFNLRPDALPYRHVIGQVAIDKVANIRTVIHKAANIASDFRTFEMDLMAGEPNYITSVCENQLVYHLDVSKVYWNSRLGTEHARVVKDLGNCRSTDSGSVDSNFTCPPGRVVVYDVFAGVGPFAIPAARRGCRVFANDLNPSSFEWLMRNIKENSSSKRRLDNVTCYNLDGREFIRKVVLPHYWGSMERTLTNTSFDCSSVLRYVVIMNLPALAPDFLDAFVRPHLTDESLTCGRCISESSMTPINADGSDGHCENGKQAHNTGLPLDFYCYCFVRRKTESEETIKRRIAVALGYADQPELLFNRRADGSEMAVDSWSFRFVRNVAPFKDMFCAQFRLTLVRPEKVSKYSDCSDQLHSNFKKPKLCD